VSQAAVMNLMRNVIGNTPPLSWASDEIDYNMQKLVKQSCLR
jgi:hypothetical protein